MAAHLAWADFKIKVKRIAHSTVHFDQKKNVIFEVAEAKISKSSSFYDFSFRIFVVLGFEVV